jgi:mannose-6-phosphate isomerase class I
MKKENYLKGKRSNFNKLPAIRVKGANHPLWQGWEQIADVILCRMKLPGCRIVVVETYPGTNLPELREALTRFLKPVMAVEAESAYWPQEKIAEMTFPDATNHRIFGFMTRLTIDQYLDPEKVADLRKRIDDIREGVILITGTGASKLHSTFHLPPSTLSSLIYADMPRWEIQQRMRRKEVASLGLANADAGFEESYKRGYFIDWRVADRLKKELMQHIDYVLDTVHPNKPLMITGKGFRNALQQAAHQPFSVIPFFDPGPWGGEWLREVCDLDDEAPNYAWCFNCVPEENSLLLNFGGKLFETPSINVVFAHPRELLGDSVHARFGDEFPIRFDYLDTMQGGNLSLQVHPLTEYIQEQFGIHYTQDESYYLMEAAPEAVVYLGLKEGVDRHEMIKELERAQKEGSHFDDEPYIERWPAKKHDHFLIPGGTIHCSGKNCMVLEISATPYIFTFKLWDWGRMGLDGRPRPINIEHGKNVIQWERTTPWTKKNLVDQVELIAEGDGWREEKTGLHEREFIETRRHWFTKPVLHDTHGGVNVLNLVEGREAVVESPTGAFDPFVVHYAETFIVPASVGKYSIRPFGESVGKECATIKAYIRTNA